MYVVGIDISKAQLDIATGEKSDVRSLPYSEESLAALIEEFRRTSPDLIIVEASGGLERALVAHFAEATLPVVIVNPRQVRDFARATGKRSFISNEEKMLMNFCKWRLLPLAALVLTLILSACEQTDSASAIPVQADAGEGLPRLVDLGADQCIPCKMMAPILEELRQEYTGRMEVEFIDVWKDKEKAAGYGVRMIPTQIFYDEAGKELFRRSGFIGKEDILATWKKLGYDFKD